MSKAPSKTPDWYDPEPIPFSRKGWKGFVHVHNGTPTGMVVIRCRKGDRILCTNPMDPHLVDTFDPDAWWNK